MPSARIYAVVAAAAVLAAISSAAGAQQASAESLAGMLAIPPLEQLTATVERPLFVRGRRPPAVAPEIAEETPVAVPSEEAPAELTGIVIGPEATYALLTKRDSEETELVRQGQTIADWSVEEIGPRHVVLRRGPGRLRLELFDEKERSGASKRRPAEDGFVPPRKRSNPSGQRANPRGQAQRRPARANPQRRDDDD